PRTGRVPRRRGDLEGAAPAAHAADVGDERDSRHRPCRRDDRRRPAGPADLDPRPLTRRGRPRHAQRRRRLRRYRPHAPDVQEAGARAETSGRRCAARRFTGTGRAVTRNDAISLAYLVTIITFILALRFLSSPKHARMGNWLGAVGMAIAIGATFARPGLHNYRSIILVMVIAAPIGAYAARAVKMTAMPQMVALFNGVGGGAAALIALSEFHARVPEPGRIPFDASLSTVLSAVIGSVSFAGSMVAFGKLQEVITGRPIVYPGQKFGNGMLLAALVAIALVLLAGPERTWLLGALIVGSLVFGVLFVLPIGGADMPVVIALLNAFTGLAASATGFVLHENVLIVSGMLVGASGTMLTLLMARAMGPSLST